MPQVPQVPPVRQAGCFERGTLKNQSATSATESATQSATLEYFASKGVKLYLEGDKLKYSSTGGRMTADLMALLRQNKPMLIEQLQRRDASNAPDEDHRLNIYFETLHPNTVPREDIQWIVASVIKASEEDQLKWWTLIDRWVNEIGGDDEWRWSVACRLREEFVGRVFGGVGFRGIA